MSTKHPPVGPSEQDVRDHFKGKILTDAKLMRPAYTSIWALEDGTLLWDWRNGYADITPRLRALIYATGSRSPKELKLTKHLTDATEVHLVPTSVITREDLTLRVNKFCDKEAVVFTSRTKSPLVAARLKSIAFELKIDFIELKIED